MKRRDFVKGTAVTAALSTLPALSVPWPVPRGDGARRPGFTRNWHFHLGDAPGAELPGFDDTGWSIATLPHTARIENVVTGPPGSDTYQWQGTCWYRRHFTLTREDAGRKAFLHFEGAMNVADLWLNGEYLGRHRGGWLPFAFDISSVISIGDNVLSVRLDNRDDPATGPKPLDQLDFNSYHGIYRNAHLVLKDTLFITDPILADHPAGGGLFVTFPDVSPEQATVRVQVHVRNDGSTVRRFRVSAVLQRDDRAVAEGSSDVVELAPGGHRHVVQELRVTSPALWSPRRPALHTLRAAVLEDGTVVDAETVRVGIRRIEMSTSGFRINGEPMFLRGTNRHQEYPYVGYALSDDAQYRDARKIKEAGFDYIRLSHYAHAPAFMDACDELGLVVMDCIPGWQFFNREDPAFTELQYENCRRLIRRDRNHPSVILWEVSLNETDMPPEFIRTTHAIAHEEYPGDQCHTCGWMRGYDVFIQARQHGGCREVTDIPCVVSEYGDWEYYAQNAGLNQQDWANLAPDAANSRQLRRHGEAALLQQATNFQEAHNDNLKTIAFADGLWVMYDYNRGYAPDIESSGCMDLFRIAKPSYHFFRSQRNPREQLEHASLGPMVFIATDWTPASSASVKVFSNCEEVALSLNGRRIARQRPDTGRLSTHLAHPPFTFDLRRFQAGTLEAVGFLGGRAVARHSVRTPGGVEQLKLALDEGGRPFARQGRDVAFLYAALTDASGTVVPDAWENVFFGVTGTLEVVGANPFSSEAGIAGVLLQSPGAGSAAAVHALAIVREGNRVRIPHDSLALGASVAPVDIRVTTDGGPPGQGSTRYEGPFEAAGRVRAAVFSRGTRVVEADSDEPKFLIPGSTAPEDLRRD